MIVGVTAFVVMAVTTQAAEPAVADTIIAADTPVAIRTAAPVSSKTNRPDDRFPIELAEPIMRDGVVLVPAGVRGEGEVVHAAKAGWGGRPGELIVAARFLRCGTVELPLGRFRWSETGKSRSGAALAAGLLLTPAPFLVNGGQVEIPAGTLATARVTAAVTLPPPGNGGCAQQTEASK